jgi:hypothetical protein
MINVEEEIIIDSTIASKDLKVKLDNMQGVTVVEALAPKR